MTGASKRLARTSRTYSERGVLQSGSIDFRLKRTSRRTLAISVLPDMSVEVVAPRGALLEKIKERVRARGAWIRRQQRGFASMNAPTTAKASGTSGDSFPYLGRKYVLRTVRDRLARRVTFRFEGNRMVVRCKAPSDKQLIRRKIGEWYSRQARRVFTAVLNEAAGRIGHMGITAPAFSLRRMQKRLGSCSPTGRLLLDPSLVEVSPAPIEFVMVHELCHLVHMDHGPAFQRLLTTLLPDWKEREQRLLRHEFSKFT